MSLPHQQTNYHEIRVLLEIGRNSLQPMSGGRPWNEKGNEGMNFSRSFVHTTSTDCLTLIASPVLTALSSSHSVLVALELSLRRASAKFPCDSPCCPQYIFVTTSLDSPRRELLGSDGSLNVLPEPAECSLLWPPENDLENHGLRETRGR